MPRLYLEPMPRTIYDYPSEYNAYRNAIGRCTRENHHAWDRYGGRGITVCEEWLERNVGFWRFFDHIGPKPSPELSLDRIDNDGNYEPGNVRWATGSEQQQNKRPLSDKRRSQLSQTMTKRHSERRNDLLEVGRLRKCGETLPLYVRLTKNGKYEVRVRGVYRGRFETVEGAREAAIEEARRQGIVDKAK